jgi:hypothetical protein
MIILSFMRNQYFWLEGWMTRSQLRCCDFFSRTESLATIDTGGIVVD